MSATLRPPRTDGRGVRELRAFESSPTTRWTPLWHLYELPRKRCLVPARQVLEGNTWVTVERVVPANLPISADEAEELCQSLAAQERRELGG